MIVARPGKSRETGRELRITGRSILPPSTKHALGAEEACADAELPPSAANLAHISDVIFCLMNAMRENEGLPHLRQQEQLAKASVDHSQDMVDHKFFAHDSSDGRDVVARLEQVAYIPDRGDWVVGENLAWGSGTLGTPKALVNAWMNSAAHRANLLSGDYQEVGMGLVFGTPSAEAGDGITVTTDFGTRIEPEPDEPTTPVAGSSKKKRTSRRRAALRRCAKKKGSTRRRCVRAARRIR